ncbi:MAG: hypothetical protein M0Q43_10745 [Methanothrix sp.]|nr:hypothetical protein [Methanothrix sp.]
MSRVTPGFFGASTPTGFNPRRYATGGDRAREPDFRVLLGVPASETSEWDACRDKCRYGTATHIALDNYTDRTRCTQRRRNTG